MGCWKSRLEQGMGGVVAAVRGEAAFPYGFEANARALNILRAAG